MLWRPPSVSKSFPDSPTSFHSFNGPQLSMTSITIPPEREYRYLLAMRECDFLLESHSSLCDQYFPQPSVSRVYFCSPLCSRCPLWLLRDDHRRHKPICKSGDSHIKWSSNETLAFERWRNG